jgi:hypothetical protein
VLEVIEQREACCLVISAADQGYPVLLLHDQPASAVRTRPARCAM